MLVVENSDTYATLLALLHENSGPIGHVAFGSGRAFESSASLLAEIPGVQKILYYGDLDADGLEIPARASATAIEHGLPPVQPAGGLYRLLLEGTPSASQTISPERAHRLAEWLPSDLTTTATTILQSGNRIAQEAKNRNALREDDRWCIWQ